MSLKSYFRGDGAMHDNERRLGFGGFVDHLLPIVGIGLLTWLCLATMTLQQQVATLLERTTNQSYGEARNTADIQSLRNSQAELRQEFVELRTKR